MIDTVIGRDSEEPAAESVALIVTIEEGEHLDEDLLGEIPGILRPPDHPEAEVVDRPSVALQEQGESILLAPFAPADELQIAATVEHGKAKIVGDFGKGQPAVALTLANRPA
jgi:hypothetical protein